MVGPVSIVVCTTGCTLTASTLGADTSGHSALQQLRRFGRFSSLGGFGASATSSTTSGFQPRCRNLQRRGGFCFCRYGRCFGLRHDLRRLILWAVQLVNGCRRLFRHWRLRCGISATSSGAAGATGSSTGASAMSVFGMALLCSAAVPFYCRRHGQ